VSLGGGRGRGWPMLRAGAGLRPISIHNTCSTNHAASKHGSASPPDSSRRRSAPTQQGMLPSFGKRLTLAEPKLGFVSIQNQKRVSNSDFVPPSLPGRGRLPPSVPARQGYDRPPVHPVPRPRRLDAEHYAPPPHARSHSPYTDSMAPSPIGVSIERLQATLQSRMDPVVCKRQWSALLSTHLRPSPCELWSQHHAVSSSA
jgi:hypothetical protein